MSLDGDISFSRDLLSELLHGLPRPLSLKSGALIFSGLLIILELTILELFRFYLLGFIDKVTVLAHVQVLALWIIL